MKLWQEVHKQQQSLPPELAQPVLLVQTIGKGHEFSEHMAAAKLVTIELLLDEHHEAFRELGLLLQLSARGKWNGHQLIQFLDPYHISKAR